MKPLLCITAAGALFLAGCSKKEGAVKAEAAPDGSTPTAAAPTQPNPQLKSTLDTVNSDIESAQYDEAVQKLLAAKATMQTEADRRAYEDRLWEANQALLEKAQTDPRARESYQALGRIATGR